MSGIPSQAKISGRQQAGMIGAPVRESAVVFGGVWMAKQTPNSLSNCTGTISSRKLQYDHRPPLPDVVQPRLPVSLLGRHIANSYGLQIGERVLPFCTSVTNVSPKKRRSIPVQYRPNPTTVGCGEFRLSKNRKIEKCSSFDTCYSNSVYSLASWLACGSTSCNDVQAYRT